MCFAYCLHTVHYYVVGCFFYGGHSEQKIMYLIDMSRQIHKKSYGRLVFYNISYHIY